MWSETYEEEEQQHVPSLGGSVVERASHHPSSLRIFRDYREGRQRETPEKEAAPPAKNPSPASKDLAGLREKKNIPSVLAGKQATRSSKYYIKNRIKFIYYFYTIFLHTTIIYILQWSGTSPLYNHPMLSWHENLALPLYCSPLSATKLYKEPYTIDILP